MRTIHTATPHSPLVDRMPVFRLGSGVRVNRDYGRRQSCIDTIRVKEERAYDIFRLHHGLSGEPEDSQ